MATHFLCSTHREWMYFHSDEALVLINDSQQKGEFLVMHGEYENALSYLGSAFEGVEILLELHGIHGIKRMFLLTRLCSLGLQINECLKNTGAGGTTHEFVHRTALWLTEAINDSSLEQLEVSYLTNCLGSVKNSTMTAPLTIPNYVQEVSHVH